MKLVVDTRERAILPFLDTLKFDYEVQQINTGDYLIYEGDQLLICIERKTYDDFAQSFKDGRYENVSKMLALREQSGCQLFFIIEGCAFPALTRKFQRIPFKNIQSAITNLMIRDKIFVIHTSDQQHTMQRIADMLTAADGIVVVPTGGYDVTTPIIPDDAAIRTQMWFSIKGVSIPLAKSLSQISVVDFIEGAQMPTKHPTGREISAATVQTIERLRAGDVPLELAFIAAIHGISSATASIILTYAGGLAKLCKMTQEEISAISIPQRTRTVLFGAVKGARVFALLR